MDPHLTIPHNKWSPHADHMSVAVHRVSCSRGKRANFKTCSIKNFKFTDLHAVLVCIFVGGIGTDAARTREQHFAITATRQYELVVEEIEPNIPYPVKRINNGIEQSQCNTPQCSTNQC